MSRPELENKAFEIIRSDMMYIGVSDTELIENISSCTDDELLDFVGCIE